MYHQLLITATRTLGFSRTFTALDLGRSVDIASARSRALVINVIQHPDALELAQCQHQIPPAHGDFGVAAARRQARHQTPGPISLKKGTADVAFKEFGSECGIVGVNLIL